ncbi:hypothetical protein [Flavobacterium gyeonganense]|uniref:Uncharacterized protein n=1 Tax=Flavobacterium gyeonganense TaxID=1310418 RepID=A0ABV5H971_9FLAO|nr:hypothetical protein [Flavobacterium gyeonganense]
MFRKYLPLEELVYHSNLTKEELIKRVQNEIEAEKSFGFGANNYSYSKPYIGKVYNNSFEIKRAINYRNSFLPVIKGSVQDHLSGSKIHVKMNLTDIVKVFMIIWLGGVFLACLGVTYTLIFDKGFTSEAGFFMFIPYFMLFFGTIMIVFGFKGESRKSVKDMEEILQAKLIR